MKLIEGTLDATGWFADWNNDALDEFGWQPCLQATGGHCPSFKIWFKSRAECEQWIAEMVIGAGWYPGEPSA